MKIIKYNYVSKKEFKISLKEFNEALEKAKESTAIINVNNIISKDFKQVAISFTLNSVLYELRITI